MENGQKEEGLWDIWGEGIWERGNHLECKQRIEKIKIFKKYSMSSLDLFPLSTF